MSKSSMMKLTTAGLLLVGVFAAVGGAQNVRNPDRPHYLNTGLFTVTGSEWASFHVALDDRRTAAPATVLLRLFDRDGAVVAREDVLLYPGQSTTLQIREPGVYRAHVQVNEPATPCERRTVLGSVEIFRLPKVKVDPPEVRLMALHDDGRGSCIPD